MEKRKDLISSLKLCRFCLCQNESLTSLYERSRTPKNAVPLPLKILSFTSIEVFPSDKMPSFICSRCKFFMDMCYEYKQICRQADETILQYIQNGSTLETVPWPSQLIKVLPKFSKSPSKEVMKTVVEGGATVQVTSQDASDSDEDDGNVFNIKIDRSDNGSKDPMSTTFKVVTSEKVESGLEEEKPSHDNKDFDEVGSESVPVKTGCWPCDECYCTYPLKQLLELHKSQKHRARNVQCNQCDATFFSKYDLMTHQLTHSEEMPFECVACSRKFRRLVLLKRHEKIMHADLPQLPCPNCPATFLSIEEVVAHQKKHISIRKKRFACVSCDKRFNEKSTLQRHIDVIHHKKPGFRCEYCPQQFSSVSKLTRHVRSHANERGYPCKYCDKSFMKSHHYTRHLRVKHREAVRSTRGPFGQMERFRCEQCEDTFDTQDDLIYHSAIHATQNLTCPLCQEKFDNVDAVTAHIKSHVNGIEFMCDLCELVFTSRAKLESHVAVAHDEEFHNDVQLDESSMELDAENEDDNDSAINVKEEDDHMVVEVKKTDDFIINDNAPETEEKANTNSEESEAETYADLSSVSTPAPAATDRAGDNQTASILRKAEEIKRKVQQKATESKKEKNKPSTNSAGASDKSLRLLEKELQELQRTNTRNEVKSTPKAVDSLRTRRPQLHTSTPKTRAIEEKRTQMLAKSSAEKKLPERRVVTKENKEPKETKEVKTNNTSAKEEKESKDKDTPKSAVKNGGADKSSASADESIRRSTRPSKVKDYAKMIRDKTESEEEESDMDDEEYDAEVEESRARARRGAARARAPGRKRGRPRKDVLKEVPNKLKKEDPAENEEERSDKEDEEEKPKPAAESEKKDASKEQIQESKVDTNKADSDAEPKPSSGVLVSPTGQTLKKVPVRALPPGVKPLPLPINARPMGSGELCEMQIGKKVVKVQKIIMTKAEVEAMAKKGLVEMKDGTMVLKQGIKLPTSDALAIKSSLVGDKDVSKNYTAKKDKAQAQE
ncbi:zinc finger protein pita-like isoform X2 [Plodia interpunctella]|uniref:zinc finger protein pita-like isoform X2 n=1 Tax=Plodia interpunctella TaxID=58824 RepID=UPI0023683776|nr:zinc finger protein 91-like isoform X2 [Plodia interpunctella]